MKLLLVLVPIFAITAAQRPTYAGSGPIGRPGLASRFKDTEETTTVPLFNRVAEDGTTARVPVDARGDGQLVDRLNQWPREHRPFWLLNADHIEASRAGQNQGNTQQGNVDFQSRANFDSNGGFQQETRPIRPNQSRSSFLGPLN